MMSLYGETYLTGIYVMVYRVKEADDAYFLENSVGDIFSIGDNGEIITVKRGGGGFQRK